MYKIIVVLDNYLFQGYRNNAQFWCAEASRVCSLVMGASPMHLRIVPV